MSLQKAVEKKFGVKPKIKTGKTGELSVFVNGKNIFAYSKSEGNMPETEALLSRIAAVQT